MTRYAILTLLSLLLLVGCRTRREAQPSVDVQTHVEADTGRLQREQTDTSHAEATAEGGVTLTEDTEITYDSTGSALCASSVVSISVGRPTCSR